MTSFVANHLMLTSRVPPLETLAHVKSLEYIISSLAKEDDTNGINERVKSLPKNLRKKLERSAFRNDSSTVINKKSVDGAWNLVETINYPSSLLNRIRVLSDEEMFELWKIFFDEKYDKVLEVKLFSANFSRLFVTYMLRNCDNALEELAINYNWFLKTDFSKLLEKFRNRLKKLTLVASAGTESAALEIIVKSGCKLESFGFHHQISDKGIGTNAIESFFKSQDCLKELNMSGWLQNVDSIEQRKELLTLLLRRCKGLRKMTLLQTDLCGVDEDLDLEYIDDEGLLKGRQVSITVKFDGFAGAPTKVRFPSQSAELYILDILLGNVYTNLKGEKWTRSVVELKTMTIGEWIPSVDWASLQKLSLTVLRSAEAEPFGIVHLPNLREVSIAFLSQEVAEENSLDYKSFASLIFDCKRLEIFNLQLEDNNGIVGFDEEDFNRRLENIRCFRLKILTLHCMDPQNDRNRAFFPFNSLCKLVDRCKDLVYLECKLESNEQVQILKNKGYFVR